MASYYGYEDEQPSWLNEPFNYYDEDEDYYSGGGGWQGLLGRFLKEEKKKEETARLDYSVLSVTVMTLCLIMVVEVVKHKLEHAALGRPYFSAVLENMYAELSTLGIVEFAVFVMTKYHTSMNKAKKGVFGDVHFALFYTALINVFQSLVLAFVTTKISHRLWVQTEALELDHYVEVREEFERVQALLNNTVPKTLSKGKSTDDSSGSTTDEEDNKSKSRRILYYTESHWQGFMAFLTGLVDWARRPALYHKYNNLLIQVSDYLLRCQQAALIKLVHISIVAWLLLTAAANLMYFVLGVAGYFKQSAETVGEALTVIFFLVMMSFVVVAVFVFDKMKRVFGEIMHRPELWETVENEDRRMELSREQLSLFWGGSPKLVISALQFMQFGYAVALSIVIMFWTTISAGEVQMTSFLVAIVVCYPLFAAVAANVIPRYTLCTSLGQLVDHKRLNQSVAHFHLEEVKRQQKEEVYMHGYEEAHGYPSVAAHYSASYCNDGQIQRGRSSDTKSMMSESDSSSELTVGELASTNTSQLRPALPEDPLGRMDQRHDMRGRQKSVSDGVALMAGLKSTKGHEEEKEEIEDDVCPSDDENEDSVVPLRTLGERPKSKSDGVAAMAALPDVKARPSMKREKSEIIASLVNLDTKSLREALDSEQLQKLNQKKESKRVRSRSDPDSVAQMRSKSKSDPDIVAHMREGKEKEGRKKTPSDGVKFMAGLNRTLAFIIPGKGKESNINDSDSDNLSDIDDIPDADQLELDEFKREHSEREKHATTKDRLCQYFVSKKFPVFSNIFGTMVAFFLVGSRVERFMRTEALVPADFVSFDFNQAITFWILSSYLIFFMIFDGLACVCIDRNSPMRKNRVVWLASMLDTVLSAVCFVVFWTAESQRCCNPSDTSDARMLYSEPALCSCPTFGSRLYGGLGTIEPWVSIIALRVFRFYIAKRIVVRMDASRGIELTKAELKAEIANENNLDPFDVHEEKENLGDLAHAHGVHQDHGDGHGDHGHGDHGHDDHGHGHGPHRGSAAELWEAAIADHPEIVAKYGMFSAELLQVMLGLEVKHAQEISSVSTLPTLQTSGIYDHEPTGRVKSSRSQMAAETYSLDEKYSSLSVQAQEIIMQGQLGKNVKAVSNHSNVVSIPENGVVPKGQAFMFQIEEEKGVEEEIDDLERLPFDAPNARLVRAMRRCDRKLVPISDKWTVVDVAMTRFEIVYFDATDGAGNLEVEASREAIHGTKGGKGLRLKDVAAGRKVVGHLRIADISSIAVERHLPSDELDNGPEAEVTETEFWKQDMLHFSRDQAWPTVKQDHLAIHSNGTTLYFRFYSDLEEAEKHQDRLVDENEVDGHIFKNNAFQWAQTIGRFCGPNQLHQSLPHFGVNSDDELRDYLVVHGNKKNRMFLATHGEHMKRHETVATAAAAASSRTSQWHLLGRPRRTGPAADENITDGEHLDV